jgi:threonine/homoserine/homoserine lactone efflux protein
MSLASYLALAAAVFILALTPGPVVVATVARSLFSGLSASIGFVAGVAAIDLAYLLLAVYGLSAISTVLGELFIAIKILGAAYLIYLGLRLWTDRTHEMHIPGGPTPRRFWKSFGEGVLVDLGNPKIILFYAAFLPIFADLDKLGTRDVAVMAAVVVGILVATNLGLPGSRRGRARSSRAGARSRRSTAPPAR